MRIIGKKLRRVIAFAKGTVNSVRTIGVDTLSKIFTWIDSACAATLDMKNQTGGAMIMGLGVLHCKSYKKINVKSSTKLELVKVGDYFPFST